MAETVKPPERISVWQAAEKYRYVNNPGSYVGPYKSSMTPYMREPMEILTSPDHTGMVFVGPAQSAKTDAVLNFLVYSAVSDPNDLMIVQPTNNASRDFSIRRLQRLYRDSPEIAKRLLPGKSGMNVFDNRFRSGMLLTLSYPSISELSGKPIPRLWLSDYDRMPENVDGEGSAFDLAAKRTTTFGRYAMTVAESSPGFPSERLDWVKKSPHEAPPTPGILALYNRGDRRRWYWSCLSCREPFEPAFERLAWPESQDQVEAAEQARLHCPHCGHAHRHDQKEELNAGARWVRDGMSWEPRTGKAIGTPYTSDIASFWLKGPAAAFATWRTLVLNYLKAKDEFERTGSEQALKTTVNVDQAEPYVLQATLGGRLPRHLQEKVEDWGGTEAEPVVPPEVRYLTAAVDVQARSFVVHIFGHAEADIFHIDMFKIRKSPRLDEDGDPETISPAIYAEDWDVLRKVIDASYLLNDKSGRRMRVRMVFCDSAGQDGVTTNAYAFWRRLRDEGKGLHQVFQLVRGQTTAQGRGYGIPRYQIRYPDAGHKSHSKAAARGDVPVAFLNSNMLKDQASGMLNRSEAGSGAVRYPYWSPEWLFKQLSVEKRTEKGWVVGKGIQNEAFDLLYYALAGRLDVRIRHDHIDWSKPPAWAAEWDRNANVFRGEPEAAPPPVPKRKKIDRAAIGEILG